MPALTFCYHNRIDEIKAAKLIKSYWNVEESDANFTYFHDFIFMITNTSKATLGTFKRFATDERFDAVDMFTISKEVHPDVNGAVLSYDSNFNPPIIQVMTERGICYTINAILAANLLATK
jgi:hypothetical protein